MMSATPAGWYPDPEDPSRQRYWDGAAWGAQAPAAPAAPPPPPYVPATPVAPGVVETFGGQPLSSVARLIGAYAIDAAISFFTFGIVWLVWAAVTAGNAQTPGKQILGMQVRDVRTGLPLTWGSYVLVRGLIGGFVAFFAYLFTLGILILMPLWDNRNQSIAAKVSNSVVVDL